MEINDYQKLALKTLNKNLDKKEILINSVMGLCGESGEAIDLVKKHLYQGHELNKERFAKELGDIAWYLAEAAHAIDIDLDDIFKMNIEKLKKRYPNGFNQNNSINRDKKRFIKRGNNMDSLEELKKEIKDFVDQRDWNQFHTPANLAKSISIEANELLECFQWDEVNFNMENVKEELADVINYCIQMATILDLDIKDIVLAKLKKNALKYPVNKCKGKSTKYNQL